MFTWFAGFRMQQFAENGLITDLSDLWPIDGMGDAFKEASTSSDGKQYFVPFDYYPWAVFYPKSAFEKNGWTPPENYDDMIALAQDMQGKGITPFAFGDKDGWPAMGTFDILNMRINGFDFHMSLMARRRGLGQHRGQAGLRDLEGPAALPPGGPAGPDLAGGRDLDGQGRGRDVPARHVRHRRDPGRRGRPRLLHLPPARRQHRRRRPRRPHRRLLPGLRRAEPGRRQGDAGVPGHRRGARTPPTPPRVRR